jgi:ferredoxin
LCPIVDEDACRGCGACESQCPALNPLAIVVVSRSPQATLSAPAP